MPRVPRVLLDHVDDYLAQRDAAAIPRGPADAEVVGVRDETLGEADLVAPKLPRLGDHGGIGHRAGPVGVSARVARSPSTSEPVFRGSSSQFIQMLEPGPSAFHRAGAVSSVP